MFFPNGGPSPRGPAVTSESPRPGCEAMPTLYGNDEDFWTSEEEGDDDDDDGVDNEKEGDEEDHREMNGRHTPRNRTLSEVSTGDTITTFVPPLAKLLDYEDLTAAPGLFVEGPSEIPTESVRPPRPNMIRKSWVIHDESPVDTFREEIPQMAMEFPFELDAFQKRAIRHVHKREHTFVAAHTSAGKTVVAEYAVALAASRGRRAIYTSPIKALSNQKFREFKQKFESVGIITGDVSLNPQAQCLIATTEILRAMLYRGDTILSQLDVVIFDEVHYINDAERGVVWEEVIILLPRDVCLVMLSATVPNHKEFADWVGRTKRREVFAISTTKRPTPLKHFLWSDNKEFLVMDQSRFRVEAFNELYRNKRHEAAVASGAGAAASQGRGSGRGALKPGAAKQQQQLQAAMKGRGQSKGGPAATGSAKQKTDAHRLQALIRRLEQTSQLPVVLFCFSRRRCESLPMGMPKLDLLTSADDRSKIHTFIKESFSCLSETDRALPQVIQVPALLSRGIGVHHGGLLPIVKEAVEILFARGLVKVLFATETFAMGVNMPARSVIFASIEKHDGRRMRTLLSSEYTQMAGRAGRRGLDLFGSVYILCPPDKPPDQEEVTKMMMEKATPLQSRFRLTFEMLLQLASQRTLRIEDMMTLSFREHSRAQRTPTLKRDMARVMKEIEEIPLVDCLFGQPEAIESYARLEFESRRLAQELHWSLWCSQYTIATTTSARGGGAASDAGVVRASSPFCVGRLAAVHSTPLAQCSVLGAIIGIEHQPSHDHEKPTFRMLLLTPSAAEMTFKSRINKLIQSIVDPYMMHPLSEVYDMTVVASGQLRTAMHYEPGAAFGYALVKNVPLDAFALLTSTVVPLESNVVKSCFDGQDEGTLVTLAQTLDRMNIEARGEWKPMTLSKNLKAVEVQFVQTLLRQKDLVNDMNASLCHSCNLKEQHFGLVKHRTDCEKVKKYIDHMLRVESLDLYEEMKLKYQILCQRNFVDSQGCITLKGQVAAAITSNDAITLTEALFANVFQDKTPAEAAALLSCFVFPERVQEVPLGPTQAVAEARQQIEDIHANLETQMRALRIPVIHEEWWKICNFGLTLVAYEWAEGKSFAEIMESAEVQEGTIVRAILRLDELVRKIKAAAKVLLDNAALETLMEQTSQLIRRDVVFAMSLYLK